MTRARRPNRVWTLDFKGRFWTGNGRRCEPLTVRDLYSRYGLLVRLLPTQQWALVQRAFTRLFRKQGQLDCGVLRVYFAQLLVGHLHEQDNGAMRPTIYKHRRALTKPRV